MADKAGCESAFSGRIEKIEQNVQLLFKAEDDIRNQIDELAKFSKPHRCGITESSGVAHKFLVEGLEFPVETWKIACGWKFGVSRVRRLYELPEGFPRHLICERCWPDARNKAPGIDVDSDEESA